MRKILIISLLLLMTASLTFGENVYGQNFYGRQENRNPGGMNNAQGYNRYDNHPGCNNAAVAEIIEKSGKITISENEIPVIKTGKEELSILIGPRVVDTLKLKSGDTVMIKGIKVPGPNWSVDGKSAVKVRELTVSGKTYQIMGRGMYGGRGMDRSRQDNRNYGRKGNR